MESSQCHNGHQNIVEKDKAVTMEEPGLFEETDWSNPNEGLASIDESNTAQGLVTEEEIGIDHHGTSGGQPVVFPSICPDAGLGTVALRGEAHHHVITEERRPGAVRVAGLNNAEQYEDDERTIEMGHEEQATVAALEESTILIRAQVVDTEEENRRSHQQERVLLERDELLRERNQLHRTMDNAVVVDPVDVTDRDAKNTNEEVPQGAAHDGDSTENIGRKGGIRGRRWFASGAILLIVVAVAVSLATVLPPDSPTPPEIPCSWMVDGSRVCHQVDYPREGFSIDYVCPASASFMSECTTCAIIAPNNASQCNSCTICANTVAYDCSNLFGGDCATQDCNGNCSSPGPPPTPSNPTPSDPDPTPPPDEIPCYEMVDGSLVCHQEDYPGEDFSVDFNCPASASTTLDCTTCTIVAPDDATQCNSCTICSDSVAYDCSNVGEGDCVIVDCNGNCSPGSSPTSPNPSISVPTGGEDDVVYGLQPSCNSVDNDKYNMCLDLESLSGFYESWMEAFAKAAQRWESIIVGNLPSISSSQLDADPQLRCTGYPSVIDDVYICGREASIDGLGGILGQAITIYVRDSGAVNPRTGEEYQFALTGMMEFDSADIAAMQDSGEFDEVVLHEMGHVVGLGVLWEDNDLYLQGSGEYASGTHADDEWKAIGCSGPLPVELHGGDGTAEGHWDEDCLGNELMTGALSGSSQPLSRITVGTFQDMGYEVDYSQANPFTTANLGVCGFSCPEERRGLRRNDRKLKAKLGSEDLDIVMRYAKTVLTKLHKEFEIGAVVRGDRNDGSKTVEKLTVLYQDEKGRVHTVHVTWDEVKDLHF